MVALPSVIFDGYAIFTQRKRTSILAKEEKSPDSSRIADPYGFAEYHLALEAPDHVQTTSRTRRIVTEHKTHLAASPLEERAFANGKTGVVELPAYNGAGYRNWPRKGSVSLLPEQQSHEGDEQHEDCYKKKSAGFLHYNP